MARRNVSPGALFMLLNEEFTARRSPHCTLCRLPLPILIVRPDEVSANWKIGTPTPCPYGCDRVIAEVAAALWPGYDLFDPASTPVTDTSNLIPR